MKITIRFLIVLEVVILIIVIIRISSNNNINTNRSRTHLEFLAMPMRRMRKRKMTHEKTMVMMSHLRCGGCNGGRLWLVAVMLKPLGRLMVLQQIDNSTIE